MSRNGPERRNEPRYAATGAVEFTVENGRPVVFVGELMDRSQSGFRVRHTNQGLSTGQQVRFVAPSLKGTARVMWSRILAGQVESGFLIV
jgi:hypothetical protein